MLRKDADDYSIWVKLLVLIVGLGAIAGIKLSLGAESWGPAVFWGGIYTIQSGT